MSKLQTHPFQLAPNTDHDCIRCGRHVSQHADKEDYLAKRQMETIIKFGHQVMYIFPTSEDEGAPFFYSVGRSLKERPELLITGPLSPDAGHYLVNAAAKLDDEAPLADGMEIPAGTLLEEYPVRVVAADPVASEMNGAISAFGDDITALQLIWPDANGAFPGDQAYEYDADVQPIFTLGGPA